MSQRALAVRASTSGPTIAAYEAGRKEPRVTTWLRMLESTGSRVEVVPAVDASTRFHDLMCDRWAQMVVDDPSILESARLALDGMSGDHTDAWRHLLDAGADAVVAVLTSRHPAASALKSDAPFGRMGLIGQDERQEMLERAYAAR